MRHEEAAQGHRGSVHSVSTIGAESEKGVMNTDLCTQCLCGKQTAFERRIGGRQEVVACFPCFCLRQRSVNGNGRARCKGRLCASGLAASARPMGAGETDAVLKLFEPLVCALLCGRVGVVIERIQRLENGCSRLRLLCRHAAVWCGERLKGGGLRTQHSKV